ncbi:MAG: phytanoyl-CoA hydroxylase [Verrucomicrobiales bacterium]|jgi:phytanoyl-CoA hydroxylase
MQQQREQFQRDGFVAVPGFLDRDQVRECIRQLDRYVSAIAPGLPPDQVFYEDKNDPSTLKQLQCIHENDAWFREFFNAAPRELAEELLGAEVIGRNLQYFNKPPGVGQPTPPHQDGFYFKLDPPDALTMWMALEDVDEETGCVRYVRGSHSLGMREHGLTGTLGFSQGIVDYGTSADQEHEIPMPADPGDLLAHHALTIHRADGNASLTRTRRALGFIFYSTDAQEDPVARAVYQESLQRQQQGKV